MGIFYDFLIGAITNTFPHHDHCTNPSNNVNTQVGQANHTPGLQGRKGLKAFEKPKTFS